MPLRKNVIRFLAAHAATVEQEDDFGITFYVVSDSVSDEIESAASSDHRHIRYDLVTHNGSYHYHVRLRGGWEYGSVAEIKQINARSRGRKE